MKAKEWIVQYEEELVRLRRHFHERPELSLQETETMRTIEDLLTNWQIETHRVEPGGILGVLDSGRPGHTVLLRADMDALPIEENPSNGKQPKVSVSAVPGVSHACGHDGHMAMLLTIAHILADCRAEWDGRVIFLFEQAEEAASPSLKNLLAYIREQGWHIDACGGTHVRWDLEAGKIGIVPGGAMAGMYGFTIEIAGKGGHGSRPDLAHSPIECFADAASRLAGLRLSFLDPQECLSYSLGSVHSGEKSNIIPETLTFSGTARYFDTERVGKPFARRLAALMDAACACHGCTWKTVRCSYLWEVRNDPACAALMKEAVENTLGSRAVCRPQPWMGSETMAAILALYPGVYIFTGIANASLGSGANHHTPEFDIDEKGLLAGAAALLAYTLHILKEKPEIPFVPKAWEAVFPQEI